MPLHIERIINRGMSRGEALGRFGRFETLHFSFELPHWLMRVLSSIVGAQSLFALTRKTDFADRRSIGFQFVGHEGCRNETVASKEAS